MHLQIKKIEFKGDHYKLQIFDTCGQETYRSIVKAHYKGKDGVILVIDMTNPNYEDVEYWLKEVDSNAKQDIPMVLVGTKMDMKKDLTFDVLQAFARKKELIFIPTSAKTGLNVDKVFEALLTEILFRDKKMTVIEEKTGGDARKLELDRQSIDKKEKKKCCK